MRAADVAAEEVGEQVAGGLVGPVRVLDDHEQRGDLGDAGEQHAYALEEVGALQPALAAVAVGVPDPSPGLEPAQQGMVGCGRLDDLGVAGGQTAQDLAEGEVRQGGVGEVDAVAGDNVPAARDGPVAQLGQEASLADAGVAPEQQRARLGVGRAGHGEAEPGLQVLQLGHASDQRGATTA
nr:hypothetical protein [Nocardioides daphniae]